MTLRDFCGTSVLLLLCFLPGRAEENPADPARGSQQGAELPLPAPPQRPQEGPRAVLLPPPPAVAGSAVSPAEEDEAPPTITVPVLGTISPAPVTKLGPPQVEDERVDPPVVRVSAPIAEPELGAPRRPKAPPVVTLTRPVPVVQILTARLISVVPVPSATPPVPDERPPQTATPASPDRPPVSNSPPRSRLVPVPVGP